MGEADELDVERLEARLMSHGVYVTDVDRTGDAVALDYESVAAADGVPHGEIGRVINVFRDLLGEGSIGIEATVSNLDGEHQGTWHVEAAWLDRLASGEFTETEFSGKVLETVERT